MKIDITQAIEIDSFYMGFDEPDNYNAFALEEGDLEEEEIPEELKYI